MYSDRARRRGDEMDGKDGLAESAMPRAPSLPCSPDFDHMAPPSVSIDSTRCDREVLVERTYQRCTK